MATICHVMTSDLPDPDMTCPDGCDIDKLSCLERNVDARKGLFQNMVQHWGCKVKRFHCQIECFKRLRQAEKDNSESTQPQNTK